MIFRSLVGGRRTLCVTLGLALCFLTLRGVAAASLDGTFDTNGTSRLTEYELNGTIVSNAPLGTAAGPIQFTYGNVLFGTYNINGTSRLTEYLLNGTIVSNSPLGTAAGPIEFTLNTLTYIPDNTGSTPEPSTWAMMILGFWGLGYMAYRRKNGTMRFA